jgi:tetratricopeptide (TPR) repeat protein
MPKLTGIVVGLIWLHAVLLTTVQAQNTWATNPQLVSALLKEDWQEVVTLLEVVNTPPPALGLVKAHALLALNRNNESLCLFLRFSTTGDLVAWQQWVETFARQHPRAAVAHYFRGDALARLERWEAALKAFHTALELHPRHALTLHGRGIVHASLGALDNAREDFREASKTNTGSRLAELFASQGTYILQRRTDATVALKWFEQALKLSPEYVLALNGRGSARVLLQDWDGAIPDLQAAKTQTLGCLSELAAVVDLNIAMLIDEQNKAISQALTQVAGIDPGFSLEEKIRTLDAMPPVQRQRAYDVLNNAAQFNRGMQGGLFQPSKTELGLSGGVKGSIVGPQPYVEGKLSSAWDWGSKAKFNEHHQTQLMDNMQQRYGITQANPIGNFKAWASQHLLPGGDYGKLSSPKGVSSREIGAKPIDTGEWNVFTLYGLAYKVKAQDIAAAKRGE